MTEQTQAFSLLQSIFPDGTIQYNDQVGLPEDFPLTDAELLEIELQLEANPIEYSSWQPSQHLLTSLKT